MNAPSHNARQRRLALLSSVCLLVALLGVSGATPRSGVSAQTPRVQISEGEAVTPSEFSGNLSTLPQLSSEPQDAVLPRLPDPDVTKKELVPLGAAPAAVEQTQSLLIMPPPLASFKGLDKAGWGAGWPPDTVGDVGPNHYVQAVNTSVGIFSKTGVRLAAFTFNAFWAGAGTGTACDTTHRGDPTVVYDPQANRWIVADFAFVNKNAPPYYECIAVSKNGDPVAGGWWRYAIRTDDATHPWLADYPKMGIWPDGLYMTANMFDMAAVGTPFKEVRVWALNRGDLEAGLPLRSRRIDLNTTTYFGLLPSNLRGAAPPAGRENLLVSESTTIFGFHVWKLHVDYVGAGTTFVGPANVTQTPYTVSPATVPSPGNSLDALRERLMMQAQYRRIGAAESLWVNHTVRTGAAGPTGIQWAQIIVTGGVIAAAPLQQQIYGNLGGDGQNRWMASLAVNGGGAMALGYSVSSANLMPDIRYNGRLSSDPLGTLPQGEQTMLPGVVRGTQVGLCGGAACIRWGDYSSMTVDPVDDCTFWYTTEYYEANGLNWQTRIGKFRFGNCGAQPFAPPVLWREAFGTGALAGSWTSQNLYPRTVGDVNADGTGDVVGFGALGVNVANSFGSGLAAPGLRLPAFGTAAGGWATQNQYPRMVGDVTGDGKADVVGFGADGVYVSPSTGAGLGGVSRWSTQFGASPLAGSWVTNTLYPRFLADVNGDNRDDVVGFGASGVYVALSTGAAFMPMVRWSTQFGASAGAGGWSSQDVYPRMLADVNGDGRDDVVGFGAAGVYVGLARPVGGFMPMAMWTNWFGASPAAGGWSSQNLFPRTLADVNGDGLADIVAFASAGTQYSLSAGVGFGPSVMALIAFGQSAAAGSWSSQDLYPRMVADMDGDHRADLVGFGGAGVWVALHN